MIDYETIKNITIREFMLKLGTIKPELINDNNFEYSLICNKNVINDFNNRNNIVKDFIVPNDTLFASRWVLGGPVHRYKFEYNLCDSQDLRNEICAYCDLSNNLKQNDITKYSCVLTCNHAFHYTCLYLHKSIKCVLCDKQINLNKRVEIFSMNDTISNNTTF